MLLNIYFNFMLYTHTLVLFLYLQLPPGGDTTSDAKAPLPPLGDATTATANDVTKSLLMMATVPPPIDRHPTVLSDHVVLTTELLIDRDVIINGSSSLDGVEPLGLFDALIGLWFPGMLSVFGIIGNALSLWVLSRDRARSATMTSLKALAVSDLVLLTGALCQQILPLACHFTGMTRTWLCLRRGYIQVYAWPVVCTAQMTTVWLTVLISTERYLAVCAPLASFCRADRRASTAATVRSAMVGQGRVFVAVLVIVSASIAFNVPRFFEFQPVFTTTVEDAYLSRQRNQLQRGLHDVTTISDINATSKISHTATSQSNTSHTTTSQSNTSHTTTSQSNTSHTTTSQSTTSHTTTSQSTTSHTTTSPADHEWQTMFVSNLRWPLVTYTDRMTVEVCTQTGTHSYDESRVMVELGDTYLRTNYIYLYVYNTAFYCLVVYAVPLLVVCLFNVRLVMTLAHCRRVWNALNSNVKRELRATRLPLVIVLVFTVCSTVSLFGFIFDAVFAHSGHQPRWLQLFTAVSNLLVILNSAVNFLLMLFFGNKFRQMLKNAVRCRKPVVSRSYKSGGSLLIRESVLWVPPGGSSISDTSRWDILNVSNVNRVRWISLNYWIILINIDEIIVEYGDIRQ